jgi:hypothetical protein
MRSIRLSALRRTVVLSSMVLAMLARAEFGVAQSSGSKQAVVPWNPAKATAAERLRGPSKAQVRAILAAHTKAREDNPHALLHRLIALPPNTLKEAQFAGNLTTLNASVNNAFLMVRETDCSLTAINSAYTLSSSSVSYTQASKTTKFEQQIHAAAGLTTTEDVFAKGCASTGVGLASNSLIFVGLTATGLRVGAFATYSQMTQSNTVFVLVTKEDGTFVSTTQLADPASGAVNPTGLIAADMNKDGINDLVSVNDANAVGQLSVTVFLGKSDGSFGAGQTYNVPGYLTEGGVVDDFDGDGNLDVVVPSNVASTFEVTFFPGKGDGTFGTAKTMALTGTINPEGLVSGDFNGDGKKDLISGYGLVLLGKGDGTFTQLATPAFATLQTDVSEPPPLATGDFNKDGKLDVAAGTGEGIVIFLGNGDGTFVTSTKYASISNGGYVTVTDLDGDGNLDIYSGDATGGVFGGDHFNPSSGYALMGNGDGSFRGAEQAVGYAPQSLQDLNGDGKLDYLSLNEDYLSNSPTLGKVNFQTYFGRGDGNFTAGPTTIVSPITIGGVATTFDQIDSYTLVDVNGDGKLDLLVLPDAASGFEVALGDGDGSFKTPTFVTFPANVSPTGLSSAVRSDGKAEILYSYLLYDPDAANPYSQIEATQVINGDGTFGVPVTTVIGTYGLNMVGYEPPLQVLDVNGDKDPDLLYYVDGTYDSNGNTITPPGLQLVLGGTGGTFQATKAALIKVVDDVTYQPVTAADVNGDGKLDLIALGQGTANTEIGVALGNGDGTFQTPKIMLLDDATFLSTLVAADFNGDGKVDLVLEGYFPPYDNGIFFGNGDGTFQSTPGPDNNGGVIPLQPLYVVPLPSTIVADINGDGRPDIAGSSFLLNQYGTTVVTTVGSVTALAASPTTVTYGGTVTLTATVTAATGSSIPTGTVTFLDGTTSLGTGTLDAKGVATLTTATLAVGTHSITANYSGDTTFSGSVSSGVTVTVNAVVALVSTTTVVSASANPVTAGQTVTFTATVTAASGTTVPTGTVTFLDGTASIGTGALNAQGVATLGIATLAVGTHSITANYGGDTTFSGSVASAVSEVVTAAVAADFSASLNPVAGTVTDGASVQTTVTLTPAGGFASAVTLSCSGLPQYTTCSFSPAAVTPNGTDAATATLTIQTDVSSAALEMPRSPGRSRGAGVALASLGSLASLGTGGLLGLALLRRRRRWGVWRAALPVLVAALVTCGLVLGCGGSKSATSMTHTTPKGTSQITVTGTAGSVTHTATYSLTVQ